MNIEILSKEEALKIIREAKDSYIEETNARCYAGMCYHLNQSLIKNGYELVYYFEIKEYIPNFNPAFFDINLFDGDLYWWHLEDTESRIKAFDKLIKYYEDL